MKSPTTAFKLYPWVGANGDRPPFDQMAGAVQYFHQGPNLVKMWYACGLPLQMYSTLLGEKWVTAEPDLEHLLDTRWYRIAPT